VIRTVRDAAFDVLRLHGLITVFANPGTLVVNWRSVTATATKASIPVWFASNEGALAVGDLRRLATLSN
jgi:hypothetical protein